MYIFFECIPWIPTASGQQNAPNVRGAAYFALMRMEPQRVEETSPADCETVLVVSCWLLVAAGGAPEPHTKGASTRAKALAQHDSLRADGLLAERRYHFVAVLVEGFLLFAAHQVNVELCDASLL